MHQALVNDYHFLKKYKSKVLKRVLLTGVTGYVGLHCALELITNGYQIRGTLRNMEKSNVVLDTLSGYVDTQGKIEFCALDLLSDEGWD